MKALFRNSRALTSVGFLFSMLAFSANIRASVLNYDVITPGQVSFMPGPVPPLTSDVIGEFLPTIGGPPGTQEWYSEIPGVLVYENPDSTLGCDWPGPPAGFCYNDEYFYSANGQGLGGPALSLTTQAEIPSR